MNDIRTAIVGVGNCASSLVQGIYYYENLKGTADESVGLAHPVLGPYRPGDIRIVAAVDIDARKVGRPLHEAIFAPPNNTKVFFDDFACDDVTVRMGAVLDGVGEHLNQYPPTSGLSLPTRPRRPSTT